MEKEQYRFDNVYKKVYEYKERINSYVFIGSYLRFGIEKKNRDSTKIRKIQETADHYNDETPGQ